MGMDVSKYLAMEARLASNRKRADFVEASTGTPVKRERDLHDSIESHCVMMGYLYRHDRMDKPTTGQVGWPDFVIFMPFRAVVFLECKRKGSKATTEQLAKLAHANKLGFIAEIVTNMDEVHAAINKAK